jgi:hypothetical protein
MSERTKENLMGEMLIKLTFPKGGITDQPIWTEGVKEFRYKNEMYDVVKSVTNKNKITYFCLRDNDEKNLNILFNELVKKNQDNDKKAKNNPPKEFSKYNLNSKIPLTPINFSGPFGFFNKLFYQSLHTETDTPPPRSA